MDLASLAGDWPAPRIPTYVDLFSGSGGFSLALDRLGYRCLAAVELDPTAAGVYRRNFPDNHLLQYDIREISNPLSDRHEFEVDLCVAGFPCQPFSQANPRQFALDSRSGLVFEAIRLVERIRPKAFFFENVPGFMQGRNSRIRDAAFRSLEELGYSVDSIVTSPHHLPAAVGGTPQSRRRLLIFGTRETDGLDGQARLAALRNSQHAQRLVVQDWDVTSILETDQELLPSPGDAITPKEQALIDCWDELQNELRASGSQLPRVLISVDALKALSRNDAAARFTSRRVQDFYLQNHKVIDKWLTSHDFSGVPPYKRQIEWRAEGETSISQCLSSFRRSGLRVNSLEYVPTITASAQAPILGPKRRRLTNRELARLQGFPDHYSFGDLPPRSVRRLIGNAVPVGLVGYWINEFLNATLEVPGAES